MAEFIINTEVKTETPTVEVTLSPQRPLALGRHTFRLVVVDDAGNQSIPQNLEDLAYGVSVTDGCIDWESTATSLRAMRDSLREVLPRR